MLASSSLLRSVPLTQQRNVAAFRPIRLAPVAARRVVQVVRAAAETAEAVTSVVAEKPTGPKVGVAHVKYQRGSVFKVRRVLDTIRGKSYEEALVLMEYMPYRACEKIIKVLMSAAANAKNNQGAMKSKLFVSEAFADGGPAQKRMQFRAQGRATKILKPTYHMSLKVTERS